MPRADELEQKLRDLIDNHTVGEKPADVAEAVERIAVELRMVADEAGEE